VIAEQYGTQGVRAVTISPGPVATGVWTSPDGLIARIAQAQGVPHEDFSQQLIGSIGAAQWCLELSARHAARGALAWRKVTVGDLVADRVDVVAAAIARARRGLPGRHAKSGQRAGRIGLEATRF
jgi:hypothetical protein